MGRMFIAQIDNAAAVTQRDILELIAGAEVPIVVHEVMITTDIEQDANEAAIELQISRFSGTYTSGSGGSTATGYALGGLGGTEDSATVEVGNTTQAVVGTGAEDILAHVWMNNRLGFHYLPAPEARPTIPGTDALVIALQAAIASTAFAGWVVYEELVG